MNRKLKISFGGQHFSRVERAETLTWPKLVEMLSAAPETDDKASVGWYSCAHYRDNYRDEEHMGPREALTFDFDHIEPTDVPKIEAALAPFEYLIYTTHSHKPEAPRLRVVLPLSRPALPDEFRAVSRKIGSLVGIELIAPESHKPAQFMFMPAVPPGGRLRVRRHSGAWVDVDKALQMYEDWTDEKSWPCARNDTTYRSDELPVPAREKPGIIGAFNRIYPISRVIEEFGLPYERVSDTRYTYTKGSRPEGARVYDDDSKLHSEHATDPARGQHSAFDLVRLHKFGHLDDGLVDVPMLERPSFREMAKLAGSLRPVRVEEATHSLAALPDLPAEAQRPAAAPAALDPPPGVPGEAVLSGGVPVVQGSSDEAAERRVEPVTTLARPLSDVLSHPTKPRWLIRDELERGVIAVLVGPRGSYKSFLALHWAARVAQTGQPVYIVSAEGGDFDRRARAWVMTFSPDKQPPIYVVERRLDLNSHDGVKAIREDCLALGIRPALFVLDTFSKLSGGLDENDNSEVRQFLGRLDNGLKRADTGFDATVLLVAHTGHGDKGRARGASALGADTDAEYIVRRHEADRTLAIVSRQRFKASPELPPLAFEPTVVQLGYQDDQGGEVTSLVLKPVDETAPPPAKELSAQHKEALVAFYQMLVEGERDYEDMIREFAESLPPPVAEDGKKARDTRIQIARRRFEMLENRGYLRRRPGSNKVSRNTASLAAEDSFEGEDE